MAINEISGNVACGNVSWHTVSVAWREVDQNETFQVASELRMTKDEMTVLLASLRDPAATVVMFPRRKRAGDNDGGFFAVGKQALVTCEARRETEEAWVARHAPPPPGQKFPRTIDGVRRRLVEEQQEAQQCSNL